MSRAAWLNVLLAAVVAALGTWVYLRPPGEAAPGHALSALKPADVRAIRVQREGAPDMALEKRQGAWALTAPFSARANEIRAVQLAEIAQARSEHRFPASDLARFELDAPQARVTLDTQSFSFGLMSPVTREQYVLTEGAVYAVHPRYGAALPASAHDLVSPRLFGPAEVPVGFELGAFTVTQRDGAWRQSPEAADPSQDDFVRWVEAWRHATAARVEAHAARKSTGDQVTVLLKDGRRIVLTVLARAPELTLARTDEKLQYTFRGVTAKRLLAPPGASAAPDKK